MFEELFASIRANRADLTEIDIPQVTDIDTMRQLIEALAANKHIVYIHLSFVDLRNPVWVAFFEALATNKSINKVDINNCYQVSNECAVAFANAIIQNDTITTLFLSASFMNHFSMVANALKENNSVTKLTVASMLPGNDNYVPLGDMLKVNNKIEELKLLDGELTQQGIQILKEALSVNNTVKQLDVEHMRDPSGVKSSLKAEIDAINLQRHDEQFCLFSEAAKGGRVRTDDGRPLPKLPENVVGGPEITKKVSTVYSYLDPHESIKLKL